MVHKGNNYSSHAPGIHPASFTFSFGDDIMNLIVYGVKRRSLPTAGSFCVFLMGKIY